MRHKMNSIQSQDWAHSLDLLSLTRRSQCSEIPICNHVLEKQRRKIKLSNCQGVAELHVSTSLLFNFLIFLSMILQCSLKAIIEIISLCIWWCTRSRPTNNIRPGFWENVIFPCSLYCLSLSWLISETPGCNWMNLWQQDLLQVHQCMSTICVSILDSWVKRWP